MNRRGAPVGWLTERGYIRIKVGGKIFMAHRIAWLLSTGRWPKNQIDHINGKRSDNRLINLREATQSENTRNSIIRNDNKSGVTGVCFHKQSKKWQADIRINKKIKYLGLFPSIREAMIVRKKAEEEYYGNFTPRNKITKI